MGFPDCKSMPSNELQNFMVFSFTASHDLGRLQVDPTLNDLFPFYYRTSQSAKVNLFPPYRLIEPLAVKGVTRTSPLL